MCGNFFALDQQILDTGSSIANHWFGGNTSQALANYQAQVANNNATIANQEEQNILSQGQNSINQQDVNTAQTVGADRARLAAGGLITSLGSPAADISDAGDLGLMEANTIRDNTLSQAYAASGQAMNAEGAAGLADYNATNIGNQNLVQDGLDGIGMASSFF